MANKRKKWLINPNFQISFTGFFTICALVNFMLFVGAVNWYFHKIEQEMSSNGISLDNPLYNFIASQLASLNTILLGISAVSAIFMFAAGIWYSNKVAGPIYRVTQDLNALSEGQDLKEFKFREGDYFQELRDALNAYFTRSKGEAKEDKSDDDDQAA